MKKPASETGAGKVLSEDGLKKCSGATLAFANVPVMSGKTAMLWLPKMYPKCNKMCLYTDASIYRLRISKLMS